MSAYTEQVPEECPDADSPSVADLFEHFLRQQRDGLVRFLHLRLYSEADVQDAAQESLSRLMRYRDVQPPHCWRPLLYRIATNVVLDQQRMSQVRRGTEQVPFEQVLTAMPSADPTPDEQLSREQMIDRMWQVVEALPPRCRDVYVLNRAEGMSYREIADLYDISVKAVEKHITRALVELRRELGDWEPGALAGDTGKGQRRVS